jgi:hypothetical protein
VEETRAHERLAQKVIGGIQRRFTGPGNKQAELWISDAARAQTSIDLVIHFLGSAWLPEQAVASLDASAMIAVLNLGAGSGIYDRTFSPPQAFDSLLLQISREASTALGHTVSPGKITLSGFSAGHGAVRAILRDSAHFDRVNSILLLDGMHTSYVPDGTPLASGGVIDSTNLVAFERFARAAMRGEKSFLVTHSEIFPGTFASTTETADWLLHSLGLKRTPVVQFGPRGMQQLSEVRSGSFEILGFAGNSAPDHIDQLHSMPEMLSRLRSLKNVHHFVFFSQDRETIRTDTLFLNSPAIEGAQITYTWRSLEPSKDKYDFSAIQSDMEFLRAHGKKLWVQLQDVSFMPTRVPVPKYLLDDPMYNGGVAQTYSDDDDNDANARRAGLVARRWDPEVQRRFYKLFNVLGKQFDGRLEGINLPETSVGFGTSGGLYPKGYQPALYRDAIIANMKALKRSFPKSIAMQYANFSPGEWRDGNDRGYLKSIYDSAKANDIAVGGPDLLPNRPGQLTSSYPLLEDAAGTVPVGIAVQDGNLEDKNRKTGKRVTVRDLLEFAMNTLHVDYIFWGTQEPYYSTDVVPSLRQLYRVH